MRKLQKLCSCAVREAAVETTYCITDWNLFGFEASLLDTETYFFFFYNERERRSDICAILFQSNFLEPIVSFPSGFEQTSRQRFFLLLTFFHLFSRNDVSGEQCRGATNGWFPPRRARCFQKKREKEKKWQKSEQLRRISRKEADFHVAKFRRIVYLSAAFLLEFGSIPAILRRVMLR